MGTGGAEEAAPPAFAPAAGARPAVLKGLVLFGAGAVPSSFCSAVPAERGTAVEGGGDQSITRASADFFAVIKDAYERWNRGRGEHARAVGGLAQGGRALPTQSV